MVAMDILAAAFPNGWVTYLTGGLFIGAGTALLFALTGRIGGMSTVFSSSWSWLVHRPFFQQARFVDSRSWRLLYAAGLVVGAFIWWRVFAHGATQSTTLHPLQLLIGGVLVGFGARLGNGCTSGHGICGLGSLQRPSLLAVLTFMVTGFITAHLLERVLP